MCKSTYVRTQASLVADAQGNGVTGIFGDTDNRMPSLTCLWLRLQPLSAKGDELGCTHRGNADRPINEPIQAGSET